MTHFVESPYLVPFDGAFRLTGRPTQPPADRPSKKECKARLAEAREQLDELQRILSAHDHHSVLLVFQAMDAAGKDGTIRAVMEGVNPAGCQVFSFKKPSDLELDHDFLWRSAVRLPERGRIGVFNRSYYEEVLVVRVHPGILDGQRLPSSVDRERIGEQRFESIRDHEKHLARNGTVVIKFFLNVSKEEQRQRFLSRLDEPEKNWKFSKADLRERGHWDAYQEAYEAALGETSRPHAPWYAIPADSKSYMRMCVAEIIVERLRGLDLHYPAVDEEVAAHIDDLRAQLGAED
ncbi:MAG: polyphosphate kinase 2 family protein [Planctomycetota bacterium]|nr:polyphosphate kinase 2 family protein [Planctomycetota bacterium]